MTLIGIHGFEGNIPAVLHDLGGHLLSKALQGFFTLLAIVLHVNVDTNALLAITIDGIVGQLLNGVQGLAPVSDEGTQTFPLQDHLIAAFRTKSDHRRCTDVHMGKQSL
ncbi:hypothetical protein SDC9_205418 [bioreactor metagenome]|uniref:Uncharacterized protein n=1 Tax=bioreactor metagenome TaxID=1076179 RepID=A0A645JBG8_9ZZZZ